MDARPAGRPPSARRPGAAPPGRRRGRARGRLVDEVWHDEPPSSALTSCRDSVRAAQGARSRPIETREPGYRLAPPHDALDLHRFERLAADGTEALERDQPEAAASCCAMRSRLWRGPALADLAAEERRRAAAAPPRRAAPARARAAHRRRPALRPARRGRAGAGGARRRASAAGGAAGAAHARALPLRAAGRRPRRVPLGARDCSWASSGSSPERRCRSWSGRSSVRTLARSRLRRRAIRRRAGAAAARDPRRRAGTASAAAGCRRWRSRWPRAARSARGTTADAGALGRRSPPRLRRARARPAPRGASRSARAAFTSLAPGADLARLALEQDVDLVLVDAPARPARGRRVLLALLDAAPCDVGVVVDGPRGIRGRSSSRSAAPSTTGRRSSSGPGWPGPPRARCSSPARDGRDGRDASRLLANASLAVQRTLGVPAEPLLVEPAPDALVEAARGASVAVVGLTDRWRREGLGRARTALATSHHHPTVLVRRGLRPGGLAPRGSETRFTWTLVAAVISPPTVGGGARRHAGCVLVGCGAAASMAPPNPCSTAVDDPRQATARPVGLTTRCAAGRRGRSPGGSRRGARGPAALAPSTSESCARRSAWSRPSSPPVASSADASAAIAV